MIIKGVNRGGNKILFVGILVIIILVVAYFFLFSVKEGGDLFSLKEGIEPNLSNIYKILPNNANFNELKNIATFADSRYFCVPVKIPGSTDKTITIIDMEQDKVLCPNGVVNTNSNNVKLNDGNFSKFLNIWYIIDNNKHYLKFSVNDNNSRYKIDLDGCVITNNDPNKREVIESV
jgi:hypothetical protein